MSTRLRAIVFDLWDTLVDWPVDGWADVQRRVAARLGLEEERFVELWRETYDIRQIGPLGDALRALGGDEAATGDVLTLRRDFTRTALAPRPGAVDTLVELRRRGFLLGMISVCSEEVAELWDETPFADLIDSAVFSCSVGFRKPDPRIYRLCLEELGVEPEEALFVGDGANDELAGAERVGMRAVLIHRPGQEPIWEEARAFKGRRITSIPEVLELC
ncbi:MAG TPA: HAD-IA family hydrolase [Gaiellaceae bacterium]